MQDDLVKVAKLVLKGELKFTDKMLLALYDSLEEELKDATECDLSPIEEHEKLDSETLDLDLLMQEFCRKFDIMLLKSAEDKEKTRLSNIGYNFSGEHLLNNDFTTISLELSTFNIKTDWHIKYIDDIDTNQVEYVWTVAKLVSSDPHVEVSRFYKVVPYYKETSDGVVQSKYPKYFCLYESLGLEDSNTKLVAVYESFCQAGFRIATQMRKINLLKEYFKQNEERKDITVCSAN